MSTSDPYWRVKELFAAALEHPAAERDAFLREACKDDMRLFEEIRQMLEAHEKAVGVISTRPPVAVPPDRTQVAPQSLIDTTIGPYKLLEVIGEGGMGMVYKAEQRTPIHRIVALKLIKLGMDTRQIIARFESERQALALMNHPNVAAVYDAGATETGRPYFVMEYVAGTPINTFCDRHKYTTRQRLELFVQACDALQHAHTKAIIHRDIKPGNILVTLQDDRPVVKVIDFGIAKATAQRLTEHTVFTETGQLIGTPEYMSPEQAELNPIDIDTRSDIYSLGVVLYELLAGALPFETKSLREAAYAQIQAIIREVEPPKLSTRLSSMQGDTAAKIAESRSTHIASLERELRGELEWIPLKAMRKDRARRYHTAIELASDIHNYLQNRPLIAGPESARYRAAKFVRRNKGPVIAATVVLLSLIVAVIGSTWGMISESRRRVIAERESIENALNLGDLLHSHEDFAAAEALYRRVIAYRPDSTDSVDRRRRAMAKMRLAALLNWEGRRPAEADELGRESVQAHREAYPPDDQNTARALEMYGEQFFETDVKKAEQLMRKSVEIRRKASPINYYTLGRTLEYLGVTLRHQFRFAEAEAVYREAVDCLRRHFPNGDPRASQMQSEMACVLIERNRFSDAEAELNDSLRRENNSWSRSYTEVCFQVLYMLWNDAEPGKGYDQKSQEWARKVIKRVVVESPSTKPSSDPGAAPTTATSSAMP